MVDDPSTDPSVDSTLDGAARGNRSRRDVLIGTLAAGGLAGCLGGDTTGGQSSPTSAPARTPTDSLKTVDTTDAGNAEFDIGDNAYTIRARGNLTSEDDRYGAIYADDAFGLGQVVEVTVDSQENTDQWIRTGIMVANDITAPGESVGDINLSVTPENGVVLGWDHDGDGYWGPGGQGRTRVGETVYPITLKLERRGPFYTGYYSTDGGETFTEIAEIRNPHAAATQDVGIFTISRSDSRSTAEFSDFQLAKASQQRVEPATEPVPLPDGSAALDRVVFGNDPSETKHDFAAETSRLVAGQQDALGREIWRNVPDADVEYDLTIGSMSFRLACDPEQTTHLTLKLAQGFDDGRVPLALFNGDEQVAYLNGRDGWSSGGGLLFMGAGTTGEWVYITMVLPPSLTAGQEELDLRLVTYDPNAPPADGYTGPSPTVYRAYTHTDSTFALPSDETETFGRDLGSPWGAGKSGDIEQAMATLKSTVEGMVEGGQQRSRVQPIQAEALARATQRDWIDAMDPAAIYETVRNTVDHHARRQASGTHPSDMFGGNNWREHGNLARAFEILAAEFEDRDALSPELPEHPDAPITRREAYADFFVEAYQWRENNRRWITNQVQIVTVACISMAHALQVLDPERAPPDSKVDAWIEQTIGAAPLTQLSGEEGNDGPNWRAGNWHTHSEAGLNREPRYSHGHGVIPSLELGKLAEDTDRADVEQRLVEHCEAMGWFRFRGTHRGSDRRAVIQNGWLGCRGTGWPGSVGEWLPYTRAPAVLAVLEDDDTAVHHEVMKRWTELMVEVGAKFDRYSNRGAERLYHVMPMYEGLQTVKESEPSTYDLPWERERAVFGDPDQGMVSLVDGETHLQACLGMNNGRHISEIARFDYQGPNSHRAGTTMLRRTEFPLDEMIERPNALVTFNSPNRGFDYGSSGFHGTPYYMPWRDEKKQVNQYLAGDEVPEREVPLASQPSGEPWPEGASFRGFCYYYREAQIGPYRIGINSTGAESRGFGPGKSFQMSVPDGGAIDLETGETVTSSVVNVGPRETKVLKIDES